MKKRIQIVFALAIISSALLLSPPLAQAQTTIEQLKADFEKGAAAEKLLAARRDAELQKLTDSGLSQSEMRIKADAVLNTYRVESSKLVAVYRQPLIEHLKEKFPGVQDSVGTPLYMKDKQGIEIRDAQGRKVIHPDFRGWSGDHDMQGSAAQVSKAQRYLNDSGFDTTGFGSKSLKDLTPGDLSAKDLELTINLDPTNQHIRNQLQDKTLSADQRARLEAQLASSQQADSMLTPGDSAHQTVANVAAQSKETYVAVSMKHDQPGFKAVMVNDHYKKAVEGLGIKGEALLEAGNRDAFQGMVKGTDKALRDSGLSDTQIDVALKKHQLDMSPEQYRELMAELKVKPYAKLYGIKADNVDAFRNVNQDLLDQSVNKTLKDASAEVSAQQQKIKDLEAQAAASTDPTERKKLTDTRDRLAGEIVDTRVKLQAVLAANDNRRKKYDLPPRERVPAADDLKLTPETSPASKHAELQAKSDMKVAAQKTLHRAGAALGLYGLYQTAIKHAEEVVAESSPDDSDMALVIETTKRGTLEAIGFTDMTAHLSKDIDLISGAMTDIGSGHYFSAFFKWNTAMVKGMGRMGVQMFEDTILTPLKDTGIALYEGGQMLYEIARDDATIARNEAEQAAQRAAIEQKMTEMPAMESSRDTDPASVLAEMEAAARQDSPVADASQQPASQTEPVMAAAQDAAPQDDLQIDPNAVAEEKMILTPEPQMAAGSDQLSREEVYRLVPESTMMPYAERVALAKKIAAGEVIDPNAQATDTMLPTHVPGQIVADYHPAEETIDPYAQGERMQSTITPDESMVDNEAMEETIEPYAQGERMQSTITPDESMVDNEAMEEIIEPAAKASIAPKGSTDTRASSSAKAEFTWEETWWVELLGAGGFISKSFVFLERPRGEFFHAITICGQTFYGDEMAYEEFREGELWNLASQTTDPIYRLERGGQGTIRECPAHPL